MEDGPTKKICSKCLVEKDIQLFNWVFRKENRKKPYCKECDKAAKRKEYKELRDFEIQRTLEWRKKNYEVYKQYQKYYNDNRRIYPDDLN